MGFFVLSHTFLWQARFVWLENECPLIETSQAAINGSEDTVITKASINYFHHCLKPGDTSVTISSCALHCQQQRKPRGSSDLHVLGLLPSCTLTDVSLTLGLSLPLCGMSPGASSSFKLLVPYDFMLFL